MEGAAEMMVALHETETSAEVGASLGDGRRCMQGFQHFIEERPQWRMETGAGFESWEIAGKKEGHPGRGDFTREKRPPQRRCEAA